MKKYFGKENMPEEEWSSIKLRYDNSVVQLNVTVAQYSPLRPYLGATDKKTSGSGFIIDARRGLVLTNAHVVEDATSISLYMPKLGKQKIGADLISILRDKDLALVKIRPEHLKDILDGEDPDQMSMDIGDNLNLASTDKVLVIGYPLGERSIKYTTGIVSGFHTDETGFFNYQTEDTFSREPMYVTITAPLNPGVSGGPLVNGDGKVVGINAAGRLYAQNIGYAIGVRVFLSNYKLMMAEKYPILPTLSLRWNSLNEDTRKYLTGKNSENGIYVRKVLPDSVLQGIEPKDIIHQISFEMPTVDKKINLKQLELGSCKQEKATAVIDSLGDIILYKGGPSSDLINNKKVVPRKISISELTDLIPVDSEIEVVFDREGSMLKLTSDFSHVKTKRIHGVYPRFQKFKWITVAGMCVTPLLLNQMGSLPKFQFLDETNKTDQFMYEDHLLITQVFPETESARLGILGQGDILTKVNGKDVSNLEDLEKAIKQNKGNYITFENDSGGFMAISKTKAKEDEKITQQFIGQ